MNNNKFYRGRRSLELNKKGFLDISFSLIFSLLIGGMILFGAIYGLSQYSKTEELTRSAVSGSELTNTIVSFESVLDEAKTGKIEFPVNTRIVSRCEDSRGLGSHTFRISEELRNKISENDFEIAANNIYVFSEERVFGENFNLFAKTFNFPFEVATIVYLTSAESEYCFSDAPKSVEGELREINQDNILLRDCESKENEDAIRVCFRASDSCDINVDYSGGVVEKNSREYYFEGNELMFAAIFSDFHNYDCGVNRLMSRAKILSDVYTEKSVLTRDVCDSEMISDLGAFSTSLDNFERLSDIDAVSVVQSEVGLRNDRNRCKLW